MHPTQPEDTRPGRTAAAAAAVGRAALAAARYAGGVWATLVGAVDRYDLTCLAGLAMLLAGLWVWFGTGPALTVAGGLVLALGVAGARAAERAAVGS